MAIQIGSKLENDYTNPLGMLSDCHRRIERFLQVLLTLTRQVQGRELQEDQRQALSLALRYFREGAPRHTFDEEESLFPRLRRSADARVQEALIQLEALEQDHVVAEATHQEIDELGNRWLTAGTLTIEDTRTLRELLVHLSALYQGHILIEDAEVFPLAQEVLQGDDLRLLAQEMAARRGLTLEAHWLPAKDSGRR